MTIVIIIVINKIQKPIKYLQRRLSPLKLTTQLCDVHSPHFLMGATVLGAIVIETVLICSRIDSGKGYRSYRVCNGSIVYCLTACHALQEACHTTGTEPIREKHAPFSSAKFSLTWIVI